MNKTVKDICLLIVGAWLVLWIVSHIFKIAGWLIQGVGIIAAIAVIVYIYDYFKNNKK